MESRGQKMKKVYVFLAEGFEEVEALSPVDILRRAGAEVTLVSVKDAVVEGARGIKVVSDISIDDMDIEKADMIILPGGFPGFENLANCEKVISAINYMIKKDRYVAAICGAPAAVLGKNGFLKDKAAVCYPGMEDGLYCKQVSEDNVCISGNIITSKSAATAMEFSIVLTELLFGKDQCEKIKKSIVYNG